MFSNEFKDSKILQWALGALVFCYFLVFRHWVNLLTTTASSVEAITYTCPPYWKNCDALYFFQALPYGYSQTFFYMIFFGILLWIVYLISEKKWKETQWTLIPFFFWHFFNIFFLTEELSLNFEFYVVGYGIILLFLPHKEFFLKLFFVALYVLSTVIKIHPAWIEGAYFTNLRMGLPIFPEWSIPLFTNLVIVMEMVGAWFLLSRNVFLQRISAFFFISFHLYSGIMVAYRYPATVLPMFLILFGPWYRHQKVPLDKKSIFGWVFIALLVFFQFSPKLIEGDEKLTLEGNKYGLYMFEANHQCVSTATFYRVDGSRYTQVRENMNARNRCNPYNFWFTFKKICERDPAVQSIYWQFDHSINGNPFLRIVDEENVCNLEYKAFSHNEWIKTENDNPEVIGWPVKNKYY